MPLMTIEQPNTDHSRLFGEIAVRLFFLSRRDLDRGLRAQREARNAGSDPTLGEVLEGLGIMTQEQVQAVLSAQQVYDDKNIETLYGRIAVKNRFITQSDLEEALRVQERTGRRLRIGEVLVKKAYMTWEQHEAVLRAQERILAGVEANKKRSGRSPRS